MADLWLTFIDLFGEGPLGSRRWGDTDQEIEYAIVEADSEAEAIEKAWSKDYALIQGRGHDEAQGGHPRSSWHLATAIRLDRLPRLRVRMTETTTRTLEIDLALNGAASPNKQAESEDR